MPNPKLIQHLRWRLKRIVVWRLALVGYIACILVVAFWPTPVDKPIHGTLTAILDYLHHRGIPTWLSYTFVEASANVVLFVPLGLIFAVTFRSQAWWKLACLASLASITLELGQLLFLAARFASILDVVTNTSGAVIGIAAARTASKRRTSPTKDR
ncbi:VanZ family protein [Arthrobacter sp. Leaf145]|uniref:VanZ family protein n=1 Tax=Paenarthrobacter nicotinovorans TaxID=29320 RepID=UPI0009E6F877